MAQARATRVPKRFTVQYGPAKKLERQGTVLNVSESGVAVKGETYAVGTDLRLVIRPADSRAFELEGKVVWCNQSQASMGVRLTMRDEPFRNFVARATTGSSFERVQPAVTAPSATVSVRTTSPATSPVPAPDQAPTPVRGTPSAASIRGVPMTGTGPISRPPAPTGPPSMPPARKPVSLPSHPIERVTTPSNYSGSFPRAVSAPPSMPPAASGPASVQARVSSASVAPVRPDATWRVRMPRFDGMLPLQMGAGSVMDGSGFTSNVSRAGLSITSDKDYPKGTKLTVVVTMPDDHLVRVSGMVIWTHASPKGKKLGVRILNADDDWTRLVDGVARKFR